MKVQVSSRLGSFRILVFMSLSLALILSCTPPVQRPTGPAADYDDAKTMFQRSKFDRALEFTDGLSTSNPPTSYTERAQVMRAVIFVGEIKSYKELAEAYEKGADKTKNSHFKGEYSRQRHDNLQLGSKAALGLGEVAHAITAGGLTLPKEVTLELPFPTIEAPVEVKDLLKIIDGGWLEPDQQEAAAVDSLRKGIQDALAEIVKGDRSKARDAVSAGPVKIDGVDFALYLGKELAIGATFYDRKHSRDPQKLRTICDVANETVKSALALLKEKPNSDQDKAIKKLQDDLKTVLKNM